LKDLTDLLAFVLFEEFDGPLVWPPKLEGYPGITNWGHLRRR
jgi:hypothetical protein